MKKRHNTLTERYLVPAVLFLLNICLAHVIYAFVSSPSYLLADKVALAGAFALMGVSLVLKRPVLLAGIYSVLCTRSGLGLTDHVQQCPAACCSYGDQICRYNQNKKPPQQRWLSGRYHAILMGFFRFEGLVQTFRTPILLDEYHLS